MDPGKNADSYNPGIFGPAGNAATVASLWSTFIPPGASSADTLRDQYAPTIALPNIAAKVIAFAGGPDSPGADYIILDNLGEGGMGVVFEAEQTHLRRRVALKMIRADRMKDPLARNSFFYEAVITAGLEHPGIIPVLEFGVGGDGRVFYAMKKASGVPWNKVIREKSRAENLEIFNRVADVVAYAHSKGVIHRDLKPGNILLGEFGEVWVGDWGVALRRNSAGDYTHAHPGGTPQYMAPEMARCDFAALGPRSDVYLLGAILFEMATGAPPHTGSKSLDALVNAANNTFFPTEKSDRILDVAYRAMAPQLDQRFDSVAVLQKTTRQVIAEHESNLLTQEAEEMLRIAEISGDYDLFQKAIALYDSALKTLPSHRPAVDGRVDAVLSYARSAYSKSDFDLALSLLKPVIPLRNGAAKLAAIVQADKTAREKRVRHMRRMLFAAIVAIICGGIIAASYY